MCLQSRVAGASGRHTVFPSCLCCSPHPEGQQATGCPGFLPGNYCVTLVLTSKRTNRADMMSFFVSQTKINCCTLPAPTGYLAHSKLEGGIWTCVAVRVRCWLWILPKRERYRLNTIAPCFPESNASRVLGLQLASTRCSTTLSPLNHHTNPTNASTSSSATPTLDSA